MANLAIHPQGTAFAFSVDQNLFVEALDDLAQVFVGKHPERAGADESSNRVELCEQNQNSAHFNRISAVTFSPCGQYLVSADHFGRIRIWSLATCDLVHELDDHDSGVTALEFCPRWNLLASGSYDERVLLWRWENIESAAPAIFREFQAPSSSRPPPRSIHSRQCIVAMAFSPLGNHLAWGDTSGNVVVRDIRGSTVVYHKKLHRQRVQALAFWPSNPLVLASASDDKSVRLVHIGLPRRNARSEFILGKDLSPLDQRYPRTHEKALNSIAFSRNGDVLVSSGRDGLVKVWAMVDPDRPELFRWSTRRDGRPDWQQVDRRLLHSFPSESGCDVDRVAFFPHGYEFATDAPDSDISVWEMCNDKGLLTHVTVTVAPNPPPSPGVL